MSKSKKTNMEDRPAKKKIERIEHKNNNNTTAKSRILKWSPFVILNYKKNLMVKTTFSKGLLSYHCKLKFTFSANIWLHWKLNIAKCWHLMSSLFVLTKVAKSFFTNINALSLSIDWIFSILSYHTVAQHHLFDIDSGWMYSVKILLCGYNLYSLNQTVVSGDRLLNLKLSIPLAEFPRQPLHLHQFIDRL